ncbi:MAG: hypothetical protein AB2692_13950 [Candidatus Thiodiazotropha sp.]
MGAWDLGRETHQPFLFALRDRNIDPERVEPREYFHVRQFENGVRISAVRTQDLANLTFEALGYVLVNPRRTTWYPRLRVSNGAQAGLRVILPPQHLAEQAHVDGLPLSFPGHRLSRPSVLAFKPRDGETWEPTLRLQDLLNWGKLQLLVHPRAHSLLNDNKDRLAGQLAVAFGDDYKNFLERKNYQDVIATIGKAITGPDAGQTALDLNGRMVFSPSEQAGWLQSPPPGRQQTEVQLWSLVLDDIGRSSLRALYSHQLGKDFPSIDEPPFRCLQTLTLRQQWDIVAQTSVPGLPALRRLQEGEGQDAAGSVDVDSPEVPQSGVLRPSDLQIRFLQQIDESRGFQHQDAGIALVTPFERASLRMTGLGATFEAAWKGNPAGVFHTLDEEDFATDNPLPPGFNLARLQINTWLGREIEVAAVEKGFLFPLGMLASLVTIHERRIFTIDGQRVSMLYRRQFISCSSEPRTYPGPYQPFDGRQFPASSVTMHTLVTPTLEIAKIDWKTGEVRGIKLEEDAIFWPRVRDASRNQLRDFVFEWSTQDAPRVRSHLLFVKNAEVRRANVMEALVIYYEKELGAREYLKRAWLDGASHAYAPAGDRPGSTSFDTVYWKLGARGRYDETSGKEFFSMDGLMEGADQPPFYPVMRKAEIAIQSLNQMMGTPKGTTEVSYYSGYLEHGIDKPLASGASSPEIFLNVEKALRFDPSRRADRSGGIASPDLNVVALSRLTGLVGGTRTARNLTTESLDFSDAEQGRFNPKQFFDGAELFGLFALEDLIDLAGDYALKHAPQMIEEVEDGARGALETVQELAQDLLEALYGADGGTGLIDDFKETIDSLTLGAGGYAISLYSIYPQLDQKLKPFLLPDADGKTEVEKALARLATGTPELAAVTIKVLSRDFKEAVQAIQQVVRDPVPRVFLGQMQELAKRFEGAINEAAGFVRDTAAEFQGALIESLNNALCASISAPDGYGHILFGQNKIDCDEFFAHPAQVLERAARGVLATGLQQLFAAAEPFLARGLALQQQLSWEVARVEQAALDALVESIIAIDHQLEPYASLADDIRDPKRQKAFKEALTAKIRELLDAQPSLALTDPKGVQNALFDLRTWVEKNLADAIKALLEELGSGIFPLPGNDPEVLLKQLVAGLQESIHRRITEPLVGELTSMLDQVRREVEAEAGLRVRAVEQNLLALLETVRASRELAAIARLGDLAHGIPGLCEAAGEAAKSAFDGLLGDTARITGKIGDFKLAIEGLRIPDGEDFDQARRARGRLLRGAEQIVDANVQLKAIRAGLAARTDKICDVPREWLNSVSDIAAHKRRFAEELQLAARDLGILQQQATLSAVATNDQLIGEAVRLAVDIQYHLMGIAGLADNANHTQLLAAIDRIEEASGLEDFVKRVKQAMDAASVHARKIEERINQVGTDAQRLEAVSRTIVDEFIKAFDQDLAGSILQTVAFPKALINKLEEELNKPLAVLAATAAKFYEVTSTATDRFVAPVLEFGRYKGGHVDTQDEQEECGAIPQGEPLATFAAIYRFVLGVADVGDFCAEFVNPLLDTQKQLSAEQIRIAALGAGTSDKELKEVAALFRDPGCNPEPQSRLLKLFCQIRALARFESGEELVARLHEKLRDLEKRLRYLATQFVPAKLTTSYAWGTRLQVFSPSANFAEMFDPKTPNAAGHHLTISGRYSFDVLDQKQQVEIKGRLEPCKLWLLGSGLNMIQIHLGETTFESVNGSKPAFKVNIEYVEVGEFLSYIKALQDWLAPKGSGFYIKPAAEPGYIGVEAGYRFATGLIQVGTLQFINVSFTAAVVLPFNNPKSGGADKPGGAIFKLALAEIGQPFLVAAPPYGGGGWIVTKAWRDEQDHKIKIQAFDVSIVFGGVAAIRFGPLRAYGSVLAGIQITQIGRIHRFTALFHSVAEGSVACFSVCVSLRVELTQYAGSLYGQASFSFSFKLGFVKFRYSVTARYKLKNSSRAGAAALTDGRADAEPAPIENPGWWSTDAPRKGSDWAAYREYMDLDILTEAA